MFNSLWSGIKDVASTIGKGAQKASNFFSNATSGLSSSLGASALSAYNTLKSGGAGNFPESNQPLQIYQVGNNGLATGVNNPNVIQYSGGGTSAGATYYNAQTPGSAGANALATSQAGGIRPSTYSGVTSEKPVWQPTVDQFGRIANQQQGIPYIDAKGKLVVPKTGFEGMAGSGGSGLTSPAPATGQQGVSGTDFARGFGGAGQGTMGSLYGTPDSDESERARGERTGSQTITDPTIQAYNTLGAQGQQTPPNTPVVPEIFAMETIQTTRDALNQLTSSSMSEQDKQTVYAQLQNNLLTAKAKLDQAQPIPEMPVVDTQEQLAYLEQSEDPFGVKQAIDQFRAEQTNLGELQRTRVELMKSVQALNDAYRPIMDEIKQNPNMPKALARRKIEALALTQKETMQGLLDQLKIINQQVDDQNEIVNRAFDIVTLSETRAERAQDNIRQNLKLYLDTGAIGGFTDLELRTFAQAANMPYEALKKAKEAALTPKMDVVTNEFADGTLRAIDKNTGKTIWSIPGAGKVGDGEGTSFTAQEQRKLEQAGLANADRQSQLNFLYGAEETIKPEYTGEYLALDNRTATALTEAGMTTSDIVGIQNQLNQGFSLKQIAKKTGMPTNLFNVLSKYVKS